MRKLFKHTRAPRMVLCALVSLGLLLSGCATPAPAAPAPPVPEVSQAPEAPMVPEVTEAPAATPAQPAPAPASGDWKETPNKDAYTPAEINYLPERIPIEFSTISLDEQSINSGELFGAAKVTMLTIWSTTCGVCIREMPHWAELAEAYEGTGFQIVGACSDAIADLPESLDVPREIVADTGADYLQLVTNLELYQSLLSGVMYVPTTIFVDGSGRAICSPVIGAQSMEGWVNTIETLMHEEA